MMDLRALQKDKPCSWCRLARRVLLAEIVFGEFVLDADKV